MVNFNGKILDNDTLYFNHNNRGIRYGDALFETIKVVNSKIFFWEEHYLRLMASMRILRMDIPMNFTMEHLESEILKTVLDSQLESQPVRIRFTVFRDTDGLYTPNTNTVSYIIEVKETASPFYLLDESDYIVDLYKDYWVNPDMLSTLKSANKIIHVTAGIYAKENDLHNCLLLNQKKNVVEAINGNIFLVTGNVIKTPPLSDGCLNGILRKQLIKMLSKIDDYTLEETSISPFELQKADELFLTNVISGIRPITRYRKKQFENTVSKKLIGRLNAIVRLS
ncbi:aminotransferase class IV [Flavobacteriaceae bacterium R38]|nr:aminotransferase class IV [Flavobacteriaceae bacterium R38]